MSAMPNPVIEAKSVAKRARVPEAPLPEENLRYNDVFRGVAATNRCYHILQKERSLCWVERNAMVANPQN